MVLQFSKLERAAVWILVAVCVLAVPVSLITGSGIGPRDGLSGAFAIPSPFEDRLIAIRLSGMLVEPEEEYFLSSLSTVDSVRRRLRKALKDRHVKGVLLRIDSPGGTVATSQEIYDYLKALKEKRVPLVVSMADVAASGGYYVACACDKIVAQPGTITGSIGVIMNSFNLKGLEEKLGIEPQIVKSGQFKDIGSPNRPMTAQEREILNNLIADAYDQFVTAVASGRKMELATVKKLADGRIYLGRQALELGLVDELGGYETALATLQKLSKERYHHKADLRVDEGPRISPLISLLERLSSKTGASGQLSGVLPGWMLARLSGIPLWLMP